MVDNSLEGYCKEPFSVCISVSTVCTTVCVLLSNVYAQVGPMCMEKTWGDGGILHSECAYRCATSRRLPSCIVSSHIWECEFLWKVSGMEVVSYVWSCVSTQLSGVCVLMITIKKLGKSVFKFGY